MDDSNIIDPSDEGKQSDVESGSPSKRWRKSGSISRIITAEVVPSKVKCLVLTRDMQVNIVGKITGKTYRFTGAGCALEVDEADADIMLMEKSSHVSCCGGTSSPYFQVR